jgi:hypothetical protein
MKPHDKPSTRLKFWSLAVCSLLVVSAAVYAYEKRSFETTKWSAEKDNCFGNNVRAGMLEAARQQLKVGMPKQEVLQLFGPPDTSSQSSISYCFGRSTYSVDYENWQIFFDKKEQFLSEKMVRS